jgi:hypothetical protein
MYGPSAAWGGDGSVAVRSWTYGGLAVPFMHTSLMTPEEMQVQAAKYEHGLPLPQAYLAMFDR